MQKTVLVVLGGAVAGLLLHIAVKKYGPVSVRALL